jgi:hypothetical protein
LIDCVLPISVELVPHQACVCFPHHNVPTNQNTTLTIIQDSQIIARPIPAYLSTLSPLLYFFSSPADVTIKNHPYRQNTKATVARIPSNQLTAFLRVSKNADHVSF